MHFYLMIAITIVATIVTCDMVANGHFYAFIPFLLITITGFIFCVLFLLLATRTYDAVTVAPEETVTLLGIENEERICYLVQENNTFDFLCYSASDGLTLTSALIGDVSITYQNDAHYVLVNSTTSTYHNEWLFLKGSTVTRTDYDYHFFIPRDAVWYPYETN